MADFIDIASGIPALNQTVTILSKLDIAYQSGKLGAIQQEDWNQWTFTNLLESNIGHILL